MALRSITSRLLHSRKYFCDKLWAALSIRWNGDVEPCPCACGNTPVFSIFQTPFHEVWNSPPYQKSRAFLLQTMGHRVFAPVPREEAFDICRNCAVPLVERYSIAWWRLKGLDITLRARLALIRGASHREMMSRKISNYSQMIRYLRQPAPRVPCYPILGSVDPTNLCNLHCPMCSNVESRDLGHPRGKMSLDAFQAIMREVGPWLIHLQLYHYGEPLLNPELPEMVRIAAREYLCRVRVSTNLAMPLSDDALRDLLYSGLDTLVVAADGADQETYAKYRRGGSLEVVLDNLRRIVAGRAALVKGCGPRIVWQYLVFSHNKDQVNLARRLARQIGVDRFLTNDPFVPARDEFAEWVSTKRERQVINARIALAPSAAPSVLPATQPPVVSSNQPFELIARVRNTTAETWPADTAGRLGAVRLGIKLYADDQRHFLHELGRGLLAAPLPPGAESEIHAILHAPSLPGSYFLKLDMLREGEVWYEWKTGDRSQPYWLKADVT
jgi:MoaA/NifB/PqqE/SkfB family radical SAM enzyme